MEESISRIGVNNEDFLVASMIDRCPKTMMLRELVQNALEAAVRAPAGARRVEIGAVQVDGARKLRIWNTGPGLDAEQLFLICDISSSVGKEQALDKNFGMGAKVASLPSNQLGLRYRSCASGRVHEVIIGKRDGAYGRLLRPDAAGALAAVRDVTEESRAEGRALDQDWTEVTLLGARPDQDTVADPYAGDPGVGRLWALSALQSRFYRLPDGVEIWLAPDLLAGRPARAFTPIATHIARRFARSEAVALANGARIHFCFDPLHPQFPDRNASQLDTLSPSQSFAALLRQDELYDVIQGKRWTLEAPNFGVSFGARHVSILVELPDDFPVFPETYRQFLRYRNGAQDQVKIQDFAALVRANRPQWLIDFVREQAPQVANLETIQQQLESLIESLGLTRRRPVARQPKLAATKPPQPPAQAAKTPAEPTPPPPERAPEDAPPDAPMRTVLESLPEFHMLRDEQDIADRNLTHRAARFYPDTHQLFVNLSYPAVAGLAELLASQAPHTVPPHEARALAEEAAESVALLRIGRALIFGLSKRSAEAGWSDAEKQQAISSEMLTLAAEDLMSSAPLAQEMFSRKLAERADGAVARLSEKEVA